MGYGRGVLRTLTGVVVGVLVSSALAVQHVSADEACDNAPLPGAPTIKVLVFGDSLTAGSAGDWTWRYRYWQQQRAAGVNADFVGPIDGMMGTLDYPVPNNETYADPCFAERQHWSVGGKKLSETMRPPWWLVNTADPPTEVAWAVENYAPDVVVQFMGLNDLGNGASVEKVIALAASFLGEVRKANPSTEVAMATTTSNRLPIAETYNARLKDVAPGWSTAESKVGIIDVMRDWEGIPDTWDGYHPHARGELHLAWDVADGLHAMGFGAAPPRPIPSVPLGPRTPPVLRVVSIDAGRVTLGWTGPVGADRELIWRRDVTAGSAWTQVAEVSLDDGFTATGLAEHRYEFRVQAAKGTAVAEGLFSNVVAADLGPVALARASAPLAESRYHAVALTWPEVEGATSYRVRWRRAGSTLWHSRVVYRPATAVGPLSAGAEYRFRVTAQHASSAGPEGPETAAVPYGTVNPALPKPRLSIVTGHRIKVTWAAGVDATRYQVLFRSTVGDWRTIAWTTRTSYLAGPLAAGRGYQIRVRAWDSYVAGLWSPIAGIQMR